MLVDIFPIKTHENGFHAIIVEHGTDPSEYIKRYFGEKNGRPMLAVAYEPGQSGIAVNIDTAIESIKREGYYFAASGSVDLKEK
jgi:hypothetical protein